MSKFSLGNDEQIGEPIVEQWNPKHAWHSFNKVDSLRFNGETINEINVNYVISDDMLNAVSNTDGVEICIKITKYCLHIIIGKAWSHVDFDRVKEDISSQMNLMARNERASSKIKLHTKKKAPRNDPETDYGYGYDDDSTPVRKKW